MKITDTMTRDERRAAIRATTANRDHLVTIHQGSSSPAETVAELIGHIGYQAARETIAEAVNARGDWDERISTSARAWAATIDTAADRDTLRAHYLTSDAIHPAHVDQLARAAAEYDAEKPTSNNRDARRIRWDMLRAIARDSQDWAVSASIRACEAYSWRAISASECRQITAIYDAWERGWCALEEAPAEAASQEAAPAAEEPAPVEPVKKEYENETTGETTRSASEALSWHRRGDLLTVYTTGGSRAPYAVAIAGAPQEAPQEDENRAHCRHIAREIDAYAAGEVKRCPDCGEIHRRDWDDIADAFRCPHCGSVGSIDDWETLSLWEYFDDAFDIEYRTTGRGADDLRSVRVMVACGGPNIYIDTASRAVELYWWSERASFPISYDAAEIIDDWAAELWSCL